MKKILCPSDFSDAADNAIAYAAKLAQATNSQLTLLNVQSVFDVTPVELVMGEDSKFAAASERLEAQSREVSKIFKISCYAQTESTARKLSSVIRDNAQKHDLVVMGSDGPDDLYQFFNGSNTYNAIVKTETPILMIPANYLYSEIKTMVYAFDFLRERTLPLSRLVPFIKAVRCTLTVLQVMEEGYSKEAEDDLKELQFIIRTIYGDDVTFKYDTIRSSNVVESINSYILRQQPDALALCSVHRNILEKLFHKSVIKNITSVSSYPLFVFHQ